MRAHSRPVQNLRMGGCFLVIAFLTAPVQFAKDLIDHHDQPGCSHTALRRKRLPQLVCRLQRVATRWRGFHVGTDQKRVHHRCRILRTQVRHAPVPSIGHSLYVDGDSIYALSGNVWRVTSWYQRRRPRHRSCPCSCSLSALHHCRSQGIPLPSPSILTPGQCLRKKVASSHEDICEQCVRPSQR